MNIENLLDQIEDILEAGSKVPLSNKTGVDASAIRTIIEDIRLNLPTEITQARAIVADRNNLLVKAKNEAVAAVTGAQEKSRALISTAEDKVRALVLKTEDYSKNKVSEAEAQAKQIVNTANEDAKSSEPTLSLKPQLWLTAVKSLSSQKRPPNQSRLQLRKKQHQQLQAQRLRLKIL